MSETEGVLAVRRALIAVADKSGLVAFGQALADRGVEIVSTGNTAKVLEEAGVPVTTVADVTGFPEMLEGRVKTLHPAIHAGILADKRKPEHLDQLGELEISPFDLVVVNLYPFAQTVADGGPFTEVIEQIDIGGPAMVRGAAKNFESIGVVVDPAQYDQIVKELDDMDGLSRDTRYRLALHAFAHTAAYDGDVAAWFETMVTLQTKEAGTAGTGEDSLPGRLSSVMFLRSALRYGENPHQRGGLYEAQEGPGPLGDATVLQGKEMSFNNWLDAEAARAIVTLFEDSPAAVIVKHHNPCGVALGGTLAEAYGKALECDRVSAFGGIVAYNQELDADAARAMAEVFTEVVIAPTFTKDALALLAEKPNLRVVAASLPGKPGLDIRPIDGGALLQDSDTITETREDMKVVTTTEPSLAQWHDLLFAWKVAARAKSNAIVLAADLATVAVGAGQMNRVTSVDIAARHAGDRARGSVLASDAFFPFRDGVDRAAEAGVAAIIQPGGSVRDEEVIAAAEEHGQVMVFTGRRHFRH